VAAGAFPLVVFAHGYEQSYADYAYVSEALAASGYVVGLLDKLSDVTPLSTDTHAEHLRVALAYLHAQNAVSSSPFFGHVATHDALLGHSTGGGADYIAAATETVEVTTVVSLAALGVVQPPNVIGTDPADRAVDVTEPALLLRGGADCITPAPDNSEAIYGNLTSSTRWLVTINEGDHCGFSDVNGPGKETCELAETLRCPGFPPTQQPTMPPGDQNALVLDLVLPWLDHFLRGRTFTDFEQAAADARVTAAHP
jgi:predicted dienelactone hydrolase